MKELIDCIEESQGKGLELINNYQQYVNDVQSIVNVDKLVIVGSGSSYNSALLAKSFIENTLQIKVELHYPNDFLNYSNYSLIVENSIVMFISQGGQTKLVIEAAKRMKELGVLTVSVTENVSSEITKNTDVVLDTNTGKESYMYRTIGVTNTILSILLFAIALSERKQLIHTEEKNSYLNSLSSVFDRFEDVIAFSAQWYEENKSELKEAESILFSGAGSYWPVAKEADIKFMEMLPLLTNSFELEELVHGPQNMFKESYVFFLLADEENDLKKAKSIKLFLEKEVNAKTYLISDEEYNIFECESHFKFFLYLIFFQVIAFYTSIERGRDLSHGIYPNVGDYVKKSI